MITISDELIQKTKKWLGKSGKEFFTNVYKEFNTLNAAWVGKDPWLITEEEKKKERERIKTLGDAVAAARGPRGIPHPVHFREGMQVRNFLRDTGLCNGWDAHDFDNNWEEIVLKAIGVK